MTGAPAVSAAPIFLQFERRQVGRKVHAVQAPSCARVQPESTYSSVARMPSPKRMGVCNMKNGFRSLPFFLSIPFA